MFHPIYTEYNNQVGISEKDPLNLSMGCMRIYPHDNDTGGFFICLMRRNSDHTEIIYDEYFEHDPWVETNVRQKSMRQERLMFEEMFKAKSLLSQKYITEGEELKSQTPQTPQTPEQPVKNKNVEKEGVARWKRYIELDEKFEYYSVSVRHPEIYFDIMATYKIPFPPDTDSLGNDLLWMQTAKYIHLVNEGVKNYLQLQKRHKLRIVHYGLKAFKINRSPVSTAKVYIYIYIFKMCIKYT